MKIFTIACFCIFSTIVCKAIEKDSREIKYAAMLASDYCKDCGENALASQVTLAGKLAMLSVSLPLFKAFVEIVKALLI